MKLDQVNCSFWPVIFQILTANQEATPDIKTPDLSTDPEKLVDFLPALREITSVFFIFH
jgi:hypothetical protein